MKFDDFLSRLLASLWKAELLEAIADNAVLFTTCYSCALGLALAAALFSVRQRAVLVRMNNSKPPSAPRSNGNT